MAAMVGSSGEGVFSTAISQSPVSDWLYYGVSCDCHVMCLFMYTIDWEIFAAKIFSSITFNHTNLTSKIFSLTSN